MNMFNQVCFLIGISSITFFGTPGMKETEVSLRTQFEGFWSLSISWVWLNRALDLVMVGGGGVIPWS